MQSINKVILTGKVTQIPEFKNFQTGNSISTIKILTIEKNKNNTIYNWHRIIFYNNLAKIVKKFINKNDFVFIEGRINNRKWLDKEQNTRYISEIISDKIKILIKDKEEEINNKIDNLNDFNFEEDIESQLKEESTKNISNDIISEIEEFEKKNEYFEYKKEDKENNKNENNIFSKKELNIENNNNKINEKEIQELFNDSNYD